MVLSTEEEGSWNEVVTELHNDIIEKNKEKAAKKKEQRGIRREQIMQNATMNTRKSISEAASYNNANEELLEKAAASRSNAKPGSMAAKANLVKDFNEGIKHSK